MKHGITCFLPPYRATVRLPGTSSDLGVSFHYYEAPCLNAAEIGREAVHVSPIGIRARPS